MAANPLHFTPQEQGYPLPVTEPVPHLPPGSGGAAVPHILSFASVVNLATRSYRWTVDEAQRHNEENARTCKQEPVIWEAIRARQYPTVQFPWHIQPDNEKDTRQDLAAKVVGDTIKRTRRFNQLKRVHLEAIWYGRMATQVGYSWDYSRGRKDLLVRDWWPVNGDKLHFKYDGRVGIRVHASAPVETEHSERGLVHFLTPHEREAFILHKFEPDDSDFWEPELAGAVHGTGVRGKIYWVWWLRSQVLAWMLDYLELIGAGGLTLAFYTAGNVESQEEVRTAMESQLRNHVILFPRHANKDTLGPGIERIEPSNSGAQLILKLVTEYFDQVIRRYIIGPYMSSEVTPSGLGFGGGSGDLLVGPFARIVKYDATDLADTYSEEWVPVLYKYMFPGLPPGRFEFDIDKPNAAEVAEATKIFFEMGGEVDEEWLRDTLGIPAPEPGNGVLAKAQPMSMVGQPGQPPPQGMPVEGAPGPDPSGQAQGQVAEAMPGQPVGPDGQPLQFSRLRRLSRKTRTEWWGNLKPAEKIWVMAGAAEELLTGRFKKARTVVVKPNITVNVPAQKPAVVTVNVPQQKPPAVVVRPLLTAPKPADIKVSVAAPKVTVQNAVDLPKVSRSVQEVERGVDGSIDRTVTTHEYEKPPEGEAT